MDLPDIRKAVGTARRPMETPQMRGRSSCCPSMSSWPGEIAEVARTSVVGVDDVGGDRMILDVGPETARRFADAVNQTGTLLWN